MWFCGAYIATRGGRDKDRATRVSSLANEEPLVVVKACIDIVWKVIREDGGDSCNGVVREGKTPLRRGRCGSIRQRTSGVKDRDVSRDGGTSGRRGSKVFATRSSDEDIIGVDGNVLMEWGEEEGVEDFLSDLGRSRRHGEWG